LKLSNGKVLSDLHLSSKQQTVSLNRSRKPIITWDLSRKKDGGIRRKVYTDALKGVGAKNGLLTLGNAPKAEVEEQDWTGNWEE